MDPAARALEEVRAIEGGERAVSLALTSADPGMALRNLRGYVLATGGLPQPIEVAVRLFAGSQSMSAAAIRDPQLLTGVLADRVIPDLDTLRARCDRLIARGGDDPRPVLRRFVRQETLRVLLADLDETLSLEGVTAGISRIADAAVDGALRVAIAELTAARGAPRDADGQVVTMTVIAFGKLGGNELNYSSDIDLLFLYSAQGLTDSDDPDRAISNRDFFVRVVERTRRLLADATPEGHCYRVDLRLRPDGSTGALTRTVRSAIDYYEQRGRTWERQALIKVRAIAGDLDLGQRQFIGALSKFVYGSPLTTNDIAVIQKLKREIERRSGGARQVKAGPGGIRDVEFTVQFLQLLNGDRLPEVREPGTLPALRRLAAAGALTAEEHVALEESYIFLRTVEHRLQTVHELQTHLLPADAEGLTRLALRMGLGGEGRDPLAEFRTLHARHTGAATNILERLFHHLFLSQSEDAARITDFVLEPESDPGEVSDWLSRHGVADPDQAIAVVRRLAESGNPRARKFFASLAPHLLLHATETPEPDRCLRNFERLVTAIGAPATFYQLLGEYEDILSVVTDLCGWSQHLADLLVRNPAMFDAFADTLVVAPGQIRKPIDDLPLESIEFAEEPEAMLADLKDLKLLEIGVRDIQRKANTENTAEDLTRLAEFILRRALRREEAEARQRYGPLMDGARLRLAVLGLGKLGAGEMSYASDLDLIFVCDAEGETTKGTGAAEVAARVVQGVVRLLSGGGAHPRIYEVDTRVRPYGKSGPVVSALAGFARYYRERADVAELQMLTKARVVAGDAVFGTEVMGIVTGVLYGEPPREDIREQVLAMRGRIEETAKGHDVKRGSGGIVDVEFLVEYLKLTHGHRLPSLRTPGTLDALAAARREGLLTVREFEGLLTSIQFLRSVESRMRIVYDMAKARLPEDPEELNRLARRLGYEDSDVYPAGAALLEEYRYHTETTRKLFRGVLKTE